MPEGAAVPAGPTAPVATPARPTRLGAFSSAPFRYLWLNSFAFFLIQSTQRFTYVWLVLVLGGGPAAAGLVSFALGIPILVVSLPAGVLSDRADRRRLLMGSQIGAFVVTVATAVLVGTGRIDLWTSYVLAVALGTTLAFGQPVRQAIVPSIVERDRLLNAISLMTLGLNVSLMAGPALGGGVIAVWGLTGAFVAQAVVYALGLLALVPLRLPAVIATAERHLGRELREGLRFILRHRGILALVGLLGASGLLMLGPFQALLPHIARDRLGRDALDASLLFTAVGAGMLVTSIVLAARGHLSHKGGVFTANLVLGGLGTAAIGVSTSYAVTMAVMFVWGLGGGIFLNLNQTLIQSHTPPELMGRVMSVHTIAFLGLSPVGSLVAGGAAGALGASTWMVICGLGLSGLAVVSFVALPTLRRMS